MNLGILGPPPYQTPYLNQQGALGPSWSKWINQLYTGLNPNYAQSYFANAAQWARTSSSFGDPTNSGSDALTSIKSNGITLTPASGSKLGVAFTPATVSSLYFVSVQLQIVSASTWIAAKLWDGIQLVSYGFEKPILLSGFYAPGTISQIELSVQLASDSGPVTVSDPSGLTSPAIFSLTQLR